MGIIKLTNLCERGDAGKEVSLGRIVLKNWSEVRRVWSLDWANPARSWMALVKVMCLSDEVVTKVSYVR